MTRERCFIAEIWNDESDAAVSVARARVAPGVTTELHSLDVDERYVIAAGRGVVEVGDLTRAVEPGDVVVIPAGVPQRITNEGGRGSRLLLRLLAALPPARLPAARITQRTAQVLLGCWPAGNACASPRAVRRAFAMLPTVL